jgi:ferritin-like protein
MPGQITRAGFIASGALLALGGKALAAAPDNDLAYLRLLVGVELLTQDYAATHKVDPLVAQMHADDGAHYRGLANLMAQSGQTAATAADVDFSYPKGTPALELGWQLKRLSLGAYLGALEWLQTPAIRLPAAQIAANEAQHLSAFARLLGKPQIGDAFATALPIAAVSDALDRYES